MNILTEAGIGKLLKKVHERATEYLEKAADVPVRSMMSVAEVRHCLPGVLKDEPQDPTGIVMQLADLGETSTLRTVGPRYFGFVNGGTLPASLGAELLTVAWDQNAAMAVMSPIASVTEEIAAQWLLDLLGLPGKSAVGFVTGGQGANTSCLSVARHHLFAQQNWDFEKKGLYGAPRIDIVVGAERHTTIDVSLRSLGFGEPTHIVDADAQGRMIPASLQQALEQCEGSVIVCCQAGNVNSGAFDPFHEIAMLCQNETGQPQKVWLHVDGAFGLWAAASPSCQQLTTGVEKADSWSIDGHKWLNVPYDCGYAITAHPESHVATFGSNASYYILGGAEAPRDNMNFVPEASRRARGIATYAALRSLGRVGVSDLVARCCELATRMARRLSDEPGIEVLNDVVLNQVLVRFGDNDERTQSVIQTIQQEGTCWAGGSVWQGGAVMRISVSNWSTREADIDQSADAIIQAHRGYNGES